MSIAATKSQRPRRIAADEAHAWARNLRLGNSLAKLVLSMCTIYVDPEGRCFPGIESLAEDTELSVDTVRKRLAWLEHIGAIVRVAQWIDDNGRRNGEGKGRRTSDEIRLMMHTEPDEIERRAKGNSDDEPADVHGSDPSPGRGSDSVQDSVSPRLAPERPSDSGKGLISEPEPEQIPPNPPSGGGRSIDEELEADVAEAIRSYPAPITDLPKLRGLMAAMAHAERRAVILGMRGYASHIAECDRKGKRRAVKDAHRWVAAGMWQGYVPAGEKAEAVAQQVRAPVDSQAGKAWSVLHKIAHMRPFESGGYYLLPRELSPQALALAAAPPEGDWEFISGDQFNNCGAWTELIAKELAGKNRPPLVWDRNPHHALGFYAPYPFPPRRDGSVCTGPPPELSNSDSHSLTK